MKSNKTDKERLT